MENRQGKLQVHHQQGRPLHPPLPLSKFQADKVGFVLCLKVAKAFLRDLPFRSMIDWQRALPQEAGIPGHPVLKSQHSKLRPSDVNTFFKSVENSTGGNFIHKNFFLHSLQGQNFLFDNLQHGIALTG